MADVFSKADRSAIMHRVKSNGNKSTEERLIIFFSSYGVTGWRRHYPVKGHPDFVFLKERIAIFVDGCFWHGHDCRNTSPVSNKEYWVAKRLSIIDLRCTCSSADQSENTITPVDRECRSAHS